MHIFYTYFSVNTNFHFLIFFIFLFALHVSFFTVDKRMVTHTYPMRGATGKRRTRVLLFRSFSGAVKFSKIVIMR